MDKLIEGISLTSIVSLGFSVFFGIFILAFVWKYGPAAIKAIQDLAIALQGLKDEIGQNRNDISDIEDRMIDRFDDLENICVPMLRTVEEINTRLKANQGG